MVIYETVYSKASGTYLGATFWFQWPAWLEEKVKAMRNILAKPTTKPIMNLLVDVAGQ